MGELRETKRSAASGALGALIVTRRPRAAIKWGAAGAALGASVDEVHRRKRRKQPPKALEHFEKKSGDVLYRRENRLSPLRATQAAVGVALVTAGGSRLKMVGRAVAQGQKSKNPNTALLFRRADQFRNGAQRGTRQISPTLRKQPEVAGAIDVVPPRLRPAAATVIGAGMYSNAKPIRRDRFVPTTHTY